MPHEPQTGLLSLDEVPPGTWAEVVRVHGPAYWQQRLFALGFRPGVPVYVEQTAPLGDPVQYRVLDSWFALRRRAARCIWVRPLSRSS